MNPSKTTTRRDFLRRVGRAAALTALGLIGLILGRRSRDSTPPTHSCTDSYGICRACPTRQRCVLPQAMSFRQRPGV